MTSFDIRPEQHADVPALYALCTEAFGPGRFARSAYRVREGVPPVSGLSLTAWQDNQLVGGVRFTAIRVGERDGGLLLGPLVVAPALAGKGHGQALVQAGLARAREAGFGFVLLVGDMPYYGRFGFTPTEPGTIVLPGPVDPSRLLAVALQDGALDTVSGRVTADPVPSARDASHP